MALHQTRYPAITPRTVFIEHSVTYSDTDTDTDTDGDTNTDTGATHCLSVSVVCNLYYYPHVTI